MGINLEPVPPSPTDEPLPITLARLWGKHSPVFASHHNHGLAGGTAGQGGGGDALLDSPFCVGDWRGLRDGYLLVMTYCSGP